MVEIYTDGSCHTQLCIGAWVAILLTGTQQQVLQGVVFETTNNRMELTAVIEALNYMKQYQPAVKTVRLVTDSQYVTGLPARFQKLAANGFANSQGKPLVNTDLLQVFLALTHHFHIELVKVKAHQKKGEAVNHNREADILARKLVREAVEKRLHGQ